MNKRGISSSVRSLTVAAMLTAMSVIIGIFCKNMLNFAEGLFRITFENFPIILSGMLYGPGAGAAVGLCSDLISYLLSNQIYPPNPIVTLGAVAVGVVSGAVSRWIVKKRGTLQIILCGGLAHLVGSMIIKTIGLYQYYGWAVLWRIPTYIVIATLEIFVMTLLMKNETFCRAVGIMPKKVKSTMTYDEALEYIHGVSWTFCKPGLERIGQLCEALGHPERSLKFVHVAGTNGKGSFSAMLSSVLCKAGYKTGLYTSPYILRFNERMQINGEQISDKELAEIVAEVKPIADGMADKPTEFELITAIAFVYFKRHGVDVVVLEAGLGGRLDSTNIIESSVLSVITGIALDHTAILGDTVEKIAAEKAGIIKHGCPVLWGGRDPGAEEIIRARALEMGSELFTTKHGSITVRRADLDGSVIDYCGLEEICLPLLGLYQPLNCANVIEAVGILNHNGFSVSEEQLRSGIADARWPARFEILSREPLIIFDGAHNPEGISSAVRSIRHYFKGTKIYAVSGVLRDKDYNFIAGELSTVCERVYTITPDNSRALTAEEFADTLRSKGTNAIPCPSVEEALTRAKKSALEDHRPLVCLGSLYTYAEVVKYVNR